MKDRLNGVLSSDVLATLSRALSANLGAGAQEQGKLKAITSNAHLLPRHMHHNRAEIDGAAGPCGCISCEQMFHHREIRRWVGAGTTAVCPRCDTAAVVGSGAGFVLTPELLHRAHQLLFEGLGLGGQYLQRAQQSEEAHRTAAAPAASVDIRERKTTTDCPNPSPASGLLPSI
jgi:hypothetical protein